jgi:hypothetical protein
MTSDHRNGRSATMAIHATPHASQPFFQYLNIKWARGNRSATGIMESRTIISRQPHGQRQIHHKGTTPQSAILLILGLVLVLILTTTLSCCNAFVTSVRILSINHLARPNTTTRFGKKSSQQLLLPLQNNRSFPNSHRWFTMLHVAKTGGKMIDTEEQFSKLVLAKDVPRPVMVFFSAPWYVR